MTINIVRRDTLAASNTITSPLERLTALYPPAAFGAPPAPVTYDEPSAEPEPAITA